MKTHQQKKKVTMSTFSKLSLVAQYDDMCRLVNKLIKESTDEEEQSISVLENLAKRWQARENAHDRDKEALKGEINSLNREIKKLNRQLLESRTALVREAEEKKSVAREKKALLDAMKQVRQLIDEKSYNDNDAHRKRIVRCLNIDPLSPIQSDDSDDCVSGLDYDRTEEDILDTERSRRSAYNDALENLPTEQPTLLCRYYNKDSDDNEPIAQHRRSAHSSSTAPSLGNNHDKLDSNQDTDTNSMETDDDNIELVRRQLQKIEAEKREKLASATSTPNMKDQKRGATLSAKSATNLMKSISAVSTTPAQNALKPHSFVSKKSFKPENCVPCGGKVGFYGDCVKCEVCGVVSHPDCKDKCPLPCVKITAPNTRSRKKILISDYVNSDAVPKVPALIVHCCNEIEREDNIVQPGLYRVVAHTKDIEDLQQKILKSKSGMPNLSKLDVNLLTGVVKRFLQSLDESLITTTLWSHFSEAIKLDSDIERKTHMSYYISYDLPTANRDTLSYLMQHLHAIAKHSDKNMMTTKNLAKAIAPTIIGNSCRNPAQSTILNETKIQIQIMETLFSIEEDFWARFVTRAQPSSSSSNSLGSRLLAETPDKHRPRTRSSRLGSTLQTPKLKPLFQ